MRTDELIRRLAAEPGPFRRLPSADQRFLTWLGFAVVCMAPAVFWMGLRPDLAHAAAQPAFLLRSALIILLACLSSSAVLIASIPGAERSAKARWGIALALMGWLGVLAIAAVLAWLQGRPDALRVGPGLGCSRDVLLLGLLPGIALFVMVGRAAPVRPGLCGALALLAAAALGALGTDLVCAADLPLHLILWHFSPVLIAGFLGLLLGDRLLRW
ncbi:MAG: DUF1109 family protein [Elusimicrobia bacterium]|nr:DUF1109 family protein [Elusimicrobiota bacterium]